MQAPPRLRGKDAIKKTHHNTTQQQQRHKTPKTLKGHWKFSPKLSAWLKEVLLKSQPK